MDLEGVNAKQYVRLRHLKEKICFIFTYTQFILHQRIKKKKTQKTKWPYCMWLCIPEGKPIWQVKILWGESHYQSNEHNKTKSEDMAEWIVLAETPNWQHFQTGNNKRLKVSLKKKKKSSNLAVIQYIFVMVNSEPFNSVTYTSKCNIIY